MPARSRAAFKAWRQEKRRALAAKRERAARGEVVDSGSSGEDSEVSEVSDDKEDSEEELPAEEEAPKKRPRRAASIRL